MSRWNELDWNNIDINDRRYYDALYEAMLERCEPAGLYQDSIVSSGFGVRTGYGGSTSRANKVTRMLPISPLKKLDYRIFQFLHGFFINNFVAIIDDQTNHYWSFDFRVHSDRYFLSRGRAATNVYVKTEYDGSTNLFYRFYNWEMEDSFLDNYIFSSQVSSCGRSIQHERFNDEEFRALYRYPSNLEIVKEDVVVDFLKALKKAICKIRYVVPVGMVYDMRWTFHWNNDMWDRYDLKNYSEWLACLNNPAHWSRVDNSPEKMFSTAYQRRRLISQYRNYPNPKGQSMSFVIDEVKWTNKHSKKADLYFWNDLSFSESTYTVLDGFGTGMGTTPTKVATVDSWETYRSDENWFVDKFLSYERGLLSSDTNRLLTNVTWTACCCDYGPYFDYDCYG